MVQQPGKYARSALRLHLRRGGTIVYVTVCVSAMFGFVALGVDIGRLYTTKAELQRAADAAALAAAWELLNEDRMNFELQEGVFAATRQEAADTAAANHVHNAAPVVDLYEDVIIGRLNDFPNLDEPMSFDDPTIWNAVAVTVQRTAVRNGSIALPFGRLLGILSTELTADATAAFDDGIVGFEVSESTGNAELLPFTLKTESWADVMSSPRDEYSYDPETGEVSGGSDGIPELNIFPGGGTWQLPPGNFGTVDIGSPDNSAADVARQILHGVNAEDLSYFGGCLMIGDVGYVDLNGDTGISAGFKDELEAVKGQPRAIPLFSSVWDPGENATFRIVSFAGIRIMHVRLTGATQRKELIVQPAFVVDDSAISSESGSSYYVYRPVQLVR